MLRRSEGTLGADRTEVGAAEKNTGKRLESQEQEPRSWRDSVPLSFWLPTSPWAISGVPEADGILAMMFEQVYNRRQDVRG